MIRAATGMHYGASPDPRHAREAVSRAISKLGGHTVGSVLLFLSPAYAFEPQAALREAAKVAGTVQVFGCCAMGLITEEDWVLDAEGASAMVFTPEAGLQALTIMLQRSIEPSSVLTLSSPNAAEIAINQYKHPKFGAVVTDEYGHGPFSLWQSGKIVEHEYSLVAFDPSLDIQFLRADSIAAISAPLQLNKANGFSLEQIELEPAIKNLNRYSQNQGETLCAVSNNNDPNFIERGDYELFHVIGHDADNGTVKLSGSARAGRYLVWAKREPQTAQRNLTKAIESFNNRQPAQPKFGLMFNNISRGPEFYNGKDQDLALFQDAFPSTPLIGFYSNAEIAPNVNDNSAIHHHSSLLALCV